jgi:hypothetical protein
VSDTIQLRRDTAANWTSADPVLHAGEPGFETDTGKFKIGDGSSSWTSLGYAGDKTYTQGFSSTATVTVTHGLNKYPAVTVMDSAGDEVIGDIAYTNLNSLVVTFSAPFSGTVTCN